MSMLGKKDKKPKKAKKKSTPATGSKKGWSLKKPTDFDNSVLGKDIVDTSGRGKVNSRASAWEQLRNKGFDQTTANRDVHGSQQLDRTDLGKPKGQALTQTLAALAGLSVFSLTWVGWGLSGYMYNDVRGVTSEVATYNKEIELASELGVPNFQGVQQMQWGDSPMERGCYFGIDLQRNQVTECYASANAVPRPQWHIDATTEAFIANGVENKDVAVDNSTGAWLGLTHISFWRILVTSALALGAWGGVHTALMRTLAAQNLKHDTTDINQYENDQHIALPNEVVRKYSLFPDVGAHSPVQPSSLLSHVMLSNKGLKKVAVAKRAEADIIDEEGEILYLKGEIMRDDDGQPIVEMVPMIDVDFGHKLFDASGLPKERTLRKFFDPSKVEYNPGGDNRDKTGKQATVAEHINETWELPLYEPQRPAGAYIVDEAPVNTMVLAMTRAGKGQTYIEPMIDMWLRESRPNNMVVNDPKGELLVKHYVRATVRGYQVVQFNLINSLKTDIYNPLGLAAEAAREGDSTKCATYVENIAEVFFPVDGADDPVWPNAANNAFKRTAYGMIDFYLEEERQMRKRAAAEDWDVKVLETELDKLWGKVTLFNCYQFFVQLSAKKLKDPVTRINEKIQAGEFGDTANDPNAEAMATEALEAAQEKMPLWDGEAELDMLTLFFNATDALPTNTMRGLVGNADKALRAMGAAEKMLASVYGIAITAMSFFADPTISTLTSGTPSQNTDLGGLSFPRRMGVRFDANYVRRFNLVGCQVLWDAYSDKEYTTNLGKDFEHEDIVSNEGWARYFFKGIFPEEKAYLRLRLLNTDSGTLIKTLFFEFTKSYQTNLKGRSYITDPIRGNKIFKNGVLVELVRKKATDKYGKEVTTYVKGHTVFKQKRLNIHMLTLDEINQASPDTIKEIAGQTNAVLQTMVRYSEQPKAVFLVTPPHLMKYAKLILILVKQLVDLNFDQSYMTKSNQKPLYKTRYMLDELGNLQSEGHGIAGFETMLSIGLGQEQQFTLILQTLQQLRDVYGESVDKIVQGNTMNIVFLKSTDDSMLDTLQKMSGTTHKSYRDSKTITQDVQKLALQTDGKVSYTYTTKEEPVISYNDLAYLSERNSIVFRAGDPPIWNRNESILPMSWKLFGGDAENTIIHPGHTYSLQTIPSLSSAKEFDVRLEQPNFLEMLSKRLSQATKAPTADDIFRKAYNYSDFDVSRLDPDVYASEVMDIVDAMINREDYLKSGADDVIDPDSVERPRDMFETASEYSMVGDLTEELERDAEPNEDVTRAVAIGEQEKAEREHRRYAQGTVSRAMLVTGAGKPLVATLEQELIGAYEECRHSFARDPRFRVDAEGNLIKTDGNIVLIRARDESEDLHRLRTASETEDAQVYADDPAAVEEVPSAFEVMGSFKKFLAELDSWEDLADGQFDSEVARKMREKDDSSLVSV